MRFLQALIAAVLALTSGAGGGTADNGASDRAAARHAANHRAARRPGKVRRSRGDVAKALEEKFGEPRKAEFVWRPQTMIAVDDEAAEKIMKLIDALEDNDDVQKVYSNAEFSDAFLAKLGG